MKTRITSIFSTSMGLITFLFAFVAFWFDKIQTIGLVTLIILGVALLAVKDDELKKAFEAITEIIKR